MRSVLLALLALAAVASTQAQIPIPSRPDGYQVGLGNSASPVQLDAFFDLLCPDCAAAWPTVLDVAQYYQGSVSVLLHTFPLPYHTFGFYAAQAAHVVADSSPQAARAFAGVMFAGQAAFWNDAVANMTSQQVLAQLTQLVAAKGLMPAEAFAAGMADAGLNEEARVSWKYGCSRTVSGTPTFFVNGVQVAGQPSWTLADWRQVIDPLLQAKPSAVEDAAAAAAAVDAATAVDAAAAAAPTIHAAGRKPKRLHQSKCTGSRAAVARTFVRSGKSCPASEPSCAYLPGQVECCLPGEMCIPNVGCRC